LSEINVLIVDDEVEICDLLTMYLNREGYRTCSVYDGIRAVEEAVRIQPNIILLDVLLLGMDGIEVCAQLRRHTEVPILFISCKGEDDDKIVALGVGGDDYIVKPFSPREVVARVKAHLRRYCKSSRIDEIKFDTLRINELNRTVHIDNAFINLSNTEFDILLLLAQNPGVVYSAEEIYRRLWVMDDMEDTRTVLVHISNLRKKIDVDLTQSRYILTIWGKGYKFNDRWLNGENMPDAGMDSRLRMKK